MPVKNAKPSHRWEGGNSRGEEEEEEQHVPLCSDPYALLRKKESDQRTLIALSRIAEFKYYAQIHRRLFVSRRITSHLHPRGMRIGHVFTRVNFPFFSLSHFFRKKKERKKKKKLSLYTSNLRQTQTGPIWDLIAGAPRWPTR